MLSSIRFDPCRRFVVSWAKELDARSDPAANCPDNDPGNQFHPTHEGTLDSLDLADAAIQFVHPGLYSVKLFALAFTTPINAH